VSKDDFNFYSFPGIDDLLVQPRPENDFYGGHYVPDGGAFADTQLTEALAQTVPYAYSQKVTAGEVDENWNYRLKGLQMGALLSKRHIGVDVDVPVDVIDALGFGSLPEAAELANAVVQPKSLVTEDASAEDYDMNQGSFERLKRLLTPQRTYPESYGYVIGAYEEPQEPLVRYLDLFDLRVYRWLEGPARRSDRQANVWLDPTYNPRPTQLILARSVTVTFKNPHKDES
jgi:hypothetical protein